MTPKALAALQKSICKWESIVLGTGEDHGDANCALCIAYLSNGCCGCPVFKATGRTGCKTTPYDEYCAYEGYGEYPASPIALFHARRMLDFLRDLLPKRVAKKYHALDTNQRGV